MLSEDRKRELIAAFTARLAKNGRNAVCPMCGNATFSLADAYLVNTLQPDLATFSLGGTSIPAIAIICNNCGYISQHALGVLGLLPREGSGDDKK